MNLNIKDDANMKITKEIKGFEGNTLSKVIVRITIKKV